MTNSPVYDEWYYRTHVYCAAIKLPNGQVWTGHRHGDCMSTVLQATGKRACEHGHYTQGFITMERSKEHPHGRFVTRREAYDLCCQTGQVKKFGAAPNLYSEDLY